MTTSVHVSLIATVKNEAHSLDRWLGSLAVQTRLPDEIVIVDGGSTDGTWERLTAWNSPVRLVLEQLVGANISQGRNAAIARATGEIVAITDAGTIADVHWLERLLAVLADDEIDVASGFFIPEGHSTWERALAATTLPDALDINPERFLPSSRSLAFRKSWWLAGVRYPEWLDYCEDLVWDLALQRAGARFQFAPHAIVRFRVRPGPRSFWQQYFRYARGDGKAGLFPRRHLIRSVAWSAALVVVSRRVPRELTMFGVCSAFYCWTPVRRLWSRDRDACLPVRETAKAISLVPIQRATGDIAKLAGYPAGLYWRLKTHRALGWRTGWQRVNPADGRFPPVNSARESPEPSWLRDDESRAGQR